MFERLTSEKVWFGAQGKVIANASLEANTLRFSFKDGTKILFHDDGYLCCEKRYMRTDDMLGDYSGAIFCARK